MPKESKKPTSKAEESELAHPAPAVPMASTEAGPVSKLTILKSKKLLGLPILTLAIVLLLVGGSAAAYLGVVVPNRPENVLKSAVTKQLNKKQQASKGSISFDLNQQGIKNVTVNFTNAVDNEAQAFSTSLEASLSGGKLPLELRSVDKNIYVKIGDLSSVRSLASLAGGAQASSAVDALNKKVSNQWIEIDQSLLKQANAGCVTDLFGGLTKKDTDQLLNMYSQNSFFTIKGTSADKIDGKSATKFDLGFDRQKADAFAGGLKDLDIVKKLNECGGNKKQTNDQEIKDKAKDELKDVDTQFYVWVDGGKNLRQLQLVANQNGTSLTATLTFTKDKVNIQKPENAKPLLEVIGDFSKLFGGIPIGGLSGQTIPASSGLSPECEAAFRAYINNGGTTPPPTNCL